MDQVKDLMKIWDYLHQSGEFHRIEPLAALFGVSPKTMRKRLVLLEQWLEKEQRAPLVRSRSLGVRVAKAARNPTNPPQSPTPLRLPPALRKDTILTELLNSRDPIKVSYLMHRCDISKNTVLKTLSEIEENVADEGLILHRRPGVGLWLEGEELDKRRLMARLSDASMGLEVMVHTVKEAQRANQQSFSPQRLFQDIDRGVLERILREVEQRFHLHFSDNAWVALLTHLSIMIARIRQGAPILLVSLPASDSAYAREYQAAEALLGRIEEAFHLRIPPEELGYITLHLIGAKVMEDVGEPDAQLMPLIDGMILAVEAAYGQDFSPIRRSLARDLYIHLRPALNRIRFGMTIQNPIYEDIRSQYPGLFEKTREAVRPLEEALQLTLSPHEISYLCLHFGAALRNTESRSLLRCALVCGSGIGTARMMQAKLTQEFILEVVGTFGAREIASVDPSSYDLIISSLPLPGRWAKDYLLVNPLLPEADLLHLEEFLLRRRCTKAPASQDAADLLRRIKKYTQLRDEDALLQEIQTWMDGMPQKPYGLMSLLGERIELQVPLKTPKEVLHRALAPLFQAGFALKSYEASVQRLLATSDSMLLTKDLAFLHAADPSVQGVGFSLVTLKTPVAFGRDATHPVRVVFAFCAPQNGEEQKEALRDLLSFLQRPGAIDGLAAATTQEEVRTLLAPASS